MSTESDTTDTMESRCRAEVDDLHVFFTDWFCGRLPDTDDAFSRCERVLSPGFQLVSPRGVVDERAPLVAAIRAAHGRRSEFRIWIEEFSWRPLRAGSDGLDTLGLARYTERQHADGVETSRISTATMMADDSAPHGVVWLHVHETWKPQPPDDPVIARFERGEFTLAEFTHEKHVEVAWRYARAFPLLEALERFIAALKRFAAAHGKHGLYHETITWTYLAIINERVAGAAPNQDFAGFAAANPDILERGKRLLERYYTGDTLWSESARKVFTWPDRGP